MEGIISDGISDNDSGYGTPIVKEADHLTRINEEFETNEHLRRENKALVLENKEIKEQLNLITRKYEKEKEEYSKLSSRYNELGKQKDNIEET